MQQTQTTAPAPMSPAEYRARKRAPLGGPTVMLTLPSGMIVEARRVSLETWIATGRLPQSLLQTLLEALPPEGQLEAAERKLKQDPQTLLDDALAVRNLVMATIVRPSIVEHVTNPDEELAASELEDTDFWFIYRWAMGLSPELPVATNEGEVSVEALKTFHSEQSDAQPVVAGTDGEQVQSAPIGDAANS